MKLVKLETLDLFKHDYSVVAKALPVLAEIGAVITSIRFRNDNQPTQILIEHTKAVHKIPNAFSIGRGRNNQGSLYVSKAAIFCGVLVAWNELH